MEHPIENIAKNPQDYKYCNQCKKINRQENEQCHSCGHQNFNRMDNEDGQNLLLDWGKKPDYLIEV